MAKGQTNAMHEPLRRNTASPRATEAAAQLDALQELQSTVGNRGMQQLLGGVSGAQPNFTPAVDPSVAQSLANLSAKLAEIEPQVPALQSRLDAAIADKNGDARSGPHGNIGSAVTTHDSVLRGRYEAKDRQTSRAAQEAIAEARKNGDPAAAMAEAENASKLRNEGRLATQKSVSPPAKKVSELIEGDRGFDKMKQTYSKRIPSVEAKGMSPAEASRLGPTADEFEIARRIAVASGEPRWYMSWAGKAGRVMGPVGVGMSAYAFGNDIYERDWSMASGDGLTLGGTGLELYALANGGAATTVPLLGLSVSAVNLGLLLGGLGIAVTSGISACRSFKAGDTTGGVVDSVGVAAGAAVTVGAGILLANAAGIAVAAGLVAAAPIIIGLGLAAAAGVGLYHGGRWLKQKLSN